MDNNHKSQNNTHSLNFIYLSEVGSRGSFIELIYGFQLLEKTVLKPNVEEKPQVKMQIL